MKLDISTDYTTTDLVSQVRAESQLSIAANFDSANVLTHLDTARQMVESDTDRSILNTSWTMKLDYFPGVIYLPKGQIQSVTSVKYIDTAGSEQTLSVNTDFYVFTGFDDGRILPVTSWPSDVNEERKDVVEVIYVAGYGATVSKDTSWAESAILAKLTDLYYGSCNMEKVYDSIVKKYRHRSIAYQRNIL